MGQLTKQMKDMTPPDKELKKINRSRKLPGGVVLVGGGAKLPGLAEFARERRLFQPIETMPPLLLARHLFHKAFISPKPVREQ